MVIGHHSHGHQGHHVHHSHHTHISKVFRRYLMSIKTSLLLSIYLSVINYTNWQENPTITTLKVIQTNDKKVIF